MPSIFKKIKKPWSKSPKKQIRSTQPAVNIPEPFPVQPSESKDTSSSQPSVGSQIVHSGTDHSFASTSSGGSLTSDASNDGQPKRKKAFSLDVPKQAVSQIVSRSVITVDSIQISDLVHDGFQIKLVIRIGKTGPAKAKLMLPAGLDLFLSPHDQQSVANVALPHLKINPATRTSGITVQAKVVANSASTAGGLERLLLKLVTEPGTVNLKVATQQAQVKAYGMTFKDIALEKDIRIRGLNHLDGALRFGKATSSALPPSRSTIQNFQIVRGDPTAGIIFHAQVEVNNPAPVSASLGDVRLHLSTDLHELRVGGTDRNAAVGTVLLPNLCLKPGNNLLDAEGRVEIGAADHPAHLAGLGLIRCLLENRPVLVKVDGSTESSDVPWVATFFQDVSISANVPALGISSKLLDGASLVPSESLVPSPDSQLFARATLRNQLGPALRIHSLHVEAFQDQDTETPTSDPSAASVSLGTIQTPTDWDCLYITQDEPVHASLPFKLSADGASLVNILKNEAHRKGIELDQNLIEALDLMPSKDGLSKRQTGAAKSSTDPHRKSSAPLDLPNLVASALSSLKVAAHIVARVSIGDYDIPSEISFVQHQLPIAITVKTARAILPSVGAPLVEALMQQATISISRLKILDLDEKGLNIEAEIGLTEFGPLDIEVHPDQGLDIRTLMPLEGVDSDVSIAKIIFSEPLRGVVGNSELLKTRIRIVPSSGPKSVSNFATFVAELIKSEELGLRLSTDLCRIVAGGAEFGAALSKEVTLPGFGGLRGLRIGQLDIIDEVPAPTGPGRGRALSSASASSNSSGGTDKEMAYHFRTRVTIPHSGRIAVALSKIEAGINFQGLQIGIVAAEDIIFSLSGEDLELDVEGYILIGAESLRHEQSVQDYRQKALETFGVLASRLLAGHPIEITATGYRAFAMGDIPLHSTPRVQVPAHLRSKSTTSSVSKAPPGLLSRSGSTSTSTSSSSHQKQVPWLDQAFQKFSVTSILQQASAKSIVKDMQVSRLSATFSEGKQLQAKVDEITARVQIPYNLSYTMLAVKAQIEVHFEGYGCIGRADIDESSLSSSPSGDGEPKLLPDVHEQQSSFPVKDLRIKPASFELVLENEEALAQLIAHLADCEVTDKLSVRGKATARVETALGELWVDVDLGEHNHVLRIEGLRGLRSSPVQYTNLQVVEATPDFLKIVFSLYLNNPSRSLEMGIEDSELTMGAYYRGSYVGRAHIGRGFSLSSGPVAVHDIHFRYCPRLINEKEVRDIPANFLSGRSTVLEIRGDDKSSKIPILIPALKNIRLSFELKPMIDRTLIDSISITLGVSALTAASVDAEFVVNNPLGVPFDLCAMSFMASYRDAPFGSCTITYAPNEPLRVPPGSPKQPGQQLSSPVAVTLAQPLEKMVGAFLQSKGKILLDLDVTARVEIQGFKIPVFNYRQPKLPLTIKGLESISKWMKFLP